MKVTIIRADGFVSINGKGYLMDLSSLDPSIHALQWNESGGEIERIDITTGKLLRNDPINSLEEFQSVLDMWDVIDKTPPVAWSLDSN